MKNKTYFLFLFSLFFQNKSNEVENEKLRVKEGNVVKCELILDKEGYLPMNDERFDKFFKMVGYGKQEDLFVAGDARANQDFVRISFSFPRLSKIYKTEKKKKMLQAYHTLFAREHNRMCKVLREKKPEWKEEKTYFLAARTVMGGKMNMVGSAYFKAYFVDVPFPADPMALYVCFSLFFHLPFFSFQ